MKSNTIKIRYSMKKGVVCVLSAILLSASLSACQSTSSPTPSTEENALDSSVSEVDSSNLECPFTSLNFDSSYEDMTALEGEAYETYDSVYNGTTYTYEKSYLDENGTIKYMFDDKNQLMCIAWTYNGESNDDLQALYDTIHKDVVSKYGESGYDASVPTNYGDVWYLEGGHIILSAMATDAQKALQYSYQNPKASEEEQDLTK